MKVVSNAVPSNRQLNEKLEWIKDGSTKEEQETRLKHVINTDQIFLPFLQMAFDPNLKIQGLPDGMPGTYKPERDIPDGVADSTARQEFRRIKGFLKDGSMQKLPKSRREEIWVQMMEGLHWKEANIMIHIKDQTLHLIYPNLVEILPSVGLSAPQAESAQKEKKSRKKKAPETT